MSFFSHASGVNITGGNFYSCGRDVNIQNNQQLAISENHSQALIGVSVPAANSQEGFQTAIEDRHFSGPQRNARDTAGTDRFSPYYISARPATALRNSNARGEGAHPITPHSPPCLQDPPIPHLRREPGRTFQALEAPQTDALAADYPGMLFHAPPGTTINGNVLPSNIYPPAWPHDAGTNIHGGTFVGGNVNNIKSSRESGIGILHRAVALAALHDAAESYPQPRCHPETRKELLEKLLTWCADDSSSARKELLKKLRTRCAESTSDDSSDDPRDYSSAEPPILWLHGPAGAGKSAVMKTLSERLEDAGQLGGTFFFKRGHPTRGNAQVLFATLALQLALNISQLKLPISRVVEETPTLVARSMDVQLRELIVKPCSTIECGPIRTVLIDGLDECEGRDVQQAMLRLLRDSLAQVGLPFRIIIASRPEPHIREGLERSSFRGLCCPVNIEQAFDDVRAYLKSEFARIHREHTTMASVPSPWPSPTVVDRLVDKSSGYFIYARIVIKFIDDKDYRPTRRLAAIEALPVTGPQSPFAALDVLYTQILSATPKDSRLVPILRVIYHLNLHASQIEELLGLEPGDVELALRGLHSVIRHEEYSVLSFIHASFGDFLHDPSRACEFYIGDAVGLGHLAHLVLSEFCYMYEDPEKNAKAPIALSLQYGLRSLLEQVAPSEEDLVRLMREINLDLIIHSGPALVGLSSWLQRVQSPHLLHMWEDLEFLWNCPRWHELLKPLSDQPSALMDQLTECPLLLKIFHAYLWADDDDVGHTELRYLLNLSWDELRAAICRLRSMCRGYDPPNLHEVSRFIHKLMTKSPTWRENISMDLAFGCIRVRNLIETEDLPNWLWYPSIHWGRFIRGSPCSEELLSGIKEFAPPDLRIEWWEEVHQEQECYDIIRWLKRFPEPPLEEISRWEIFFREEQRKSEERKPDYGPPNDYDERWQKYDEMWPE